MCLSASNSQSDFDCMCVCKCLLVTAMGYRDEESEDESKGRSDVLQYGSILETYVRRMKLGNGAVGRIELTEITFIFRASTLVTERMMKPWLHPYPFFQFYNYITGNDKVFEKAFELPLQVSIVVDDELHSRKCIVH